jgi:hypothetical protein
MKTNADDCAYPVIIDDVSTKQFSEPGLSKREYFAAVALQGLLAKCIIDFSEDADYCTPKTRAKQSVLLADALIEALNNPTN